MQMNNYLISISIRNLARQKRRNFFLGLAIAIGMMILVISNAFTNGISDVMFNRIMRWVTGHVTISFNEKGNIRREVCRDRERMISAIMESDGETVSEIDESIGTFAKAIGNGSADNIILVAVDLSKSVDAKKLKETEESFKMVEGSFYDLKRTDIENAAILSEEKARYLNVRKNDVIRLRFRNIYGQDQAARLTVTGIMKNSNIFMQPVVFSEMSNVRHVMGFRPWETGNINVVLKNPKKDAVALADRIHEKLTPGRAIIYGTLAYAGNSTPVAVTGYRSDNESLAKLAGILEPSGNSEIKKDGAFISAKLAKRMGINSGSRVLVNYPNKFEEKSSVFPIKITGTFNGDINDNLIIVNEADFYNAYYDNLPRVSPENTAPAFSLAETHPLSALLATEWILLKRTANTDELKKKYQDMGKQKWKATLVDVRTMYESASDILKLEGVLNIITFSAVLVLFFIILIGVINTLRMTIKERTREIGTIRAIGMQKSDVRAIFILESFFLTLISCLAGIALAFITMRLLSLVHFEMQDNPMGMLLIQNHLHFMPSSGGIVFNLLLILLMAVATAYFPARRAAGLSPANALRHYE
ncbi:MAG: hypothetical protein A2219_07700 [Elusimicrobia bacterium RIFOXYA2_FULL_50_26]|nr:MAG: hypothetical protein A2219_07700 [Elusimicrobia bacterium RIFOXYA2_FULL_50_26]OGS24522.1 MAG: hypothetical protein A2314_05195 [Elusimicrobia bacterium RIFOXYB2_FULL_50_12]